MPEGLVFLKPAALTMDFSTCNKSAKTPRIAYVDAVMGVIAYLPSTNQGSKVTGQLQHFSNYAVAW